MSLAPESHVAHSPRPDPEAAHLPPRVAREDDRAFIAREGVGEGRREPGFLAGPGVHDQTTIAHGDREARLQLVAPVATGVGRELGGARGRRYRHLVARGISAIHHQHVAHAAALAAINHLALPEHSKAVGIEWR